ncbi:glucose-1-phosphate thymidylyltransferase [Streptomyces sp. NPDC014870]|uniref:glucose-1-phosphate thymidylyltransferase n=1 Tax=Streptomyces sp. NPDC014870 TaxID=3364925 RepID=UPI0036FE2291
MKALVLSGGSGTRLRPFSHSMPKQLIPIANKPVLEYVLENIQDIGVRHVGIITGDRIEHIGAAVGDGSRFGLDVTLLRQDAPRGLADAVRVARDFLGDDDFVMYLGDNMLLPGIEDAAAGFRAQRPDAQVLVHKVPDPRAFGVVELASDGSVARLVEKPREPRSDLALIGVYFFTPAIHDAIAAIGPSARGELEITDAIQELLVRGALVKAVEYDGYWKDTGEVGDVLECNRKVLDGLRGRVEGHVDEHSRLSGDVVIEAGARVVRSRITGPAVIGAGTVIQDSQISAYTSVGAGCVLSEAGLGDSIVLDGARLSGVRGIADSLIGRSATVAAAPVSAAGHRIVIGDHAGVEVAA